MNKRTPQFSARSRSVELSQRLWLVCALSLAMISIAGRPVLSDGNTGRESSGALTVVELYTSQGCSSCPPADAFLRDLSDRPDVLALSFHVDYWNTDEWQDPFSHKSFSLRQQAYREALNTDYVYTPQMVVGGSYAVPGGQRPSINEAIEQAASEQSSFLTLAIGRIANERIRVSVPSKRGDHSGTVYAAVYNSQSFTRVRGGENRGRTLSNINVVKRLVALAPYTGKAQSFTFSLSDLDALPSDGVAVFIQADKVGRILSAASIVPRAIPSAQVTLSQAEQPMLR